MNEDGQNGLARREVIKRAMTAVGATSLIGSTALLNAACSMQGSRTQLAANNGIFNAEQIRWLDEVAETILPATTTPGAKAAAVGAFIAIMVKDTYSPKRQARFHLDIQILEQDCVDRYNTGYLQISPEQRLALLTDVEAARFEAQGTADSDPHYFQALKELTLMGYFTSEIGYTQALRYQESPGRYDPCVEYLEGQPAWARHA